MDVDDDDDDDVADKSRRTFSGPRSLEFPTRKTKTNEISLSLSFVSFSPLFAFADCLDGLSRVRIVKELWRAQKMALLYVFVVFKTSDVSTTAQTFLLVLPRAHLFFI